MAAERGGRDLEPGRQQIDDQGPRGARRVAALPLDDDDEEIGLPHLCQIGRRAIRAKHPSPGPVAATFRRQIGPRDAADRDRAPGRGGAAIGHRHRRGGAAERAPEVKRLGPLLHGRIADCDIHLAAGGAHRRLGRHQQPGLLLRAGPAGASEELGDPVDGCR